MLHTRVDINERTWILKMKLYLPRACSESINIKCHVRNLLYMSSVADAFLQVSTEAEKQWGSSRVRCQTTRSSKCWTTKSSEGGRRKDGQKCHHRFSSVAVHVNTFVSVFFFVFLRATEW